MKYVLTFIVLLIGVGCYMSHNLESDNVDFLSCNDDLIALGECDCGAPQSCDDEAVLEYGNQVASTLQVLPFGSDVYWWFYDCAANSFQERCGE